MCDGEETAGTSQEHRNLVEQFPAAAIMDDDRQSIRILVLEQTPTRPPFKSVACVYSAAEALVLSAVVSPSNHASRQPVHVASEGPA